MIQNETHLLTDRMFFLPVFFSRAEKSRVLLIFSLVFAGATKLGARKWEDRPLGLGQGS